MNQKAKSQMLVSEPPLFVLKYRPTERLKLFFVFYILILAIGIQIVAPPPQSQWDSGELLLRLGGCWCLLLFIWAAGEMALFKEIRLYRDRIVKVWTGIGEREVLWVHAGMRGYGSKTFGSRIRWVFDRRLKWHPIFNPGVGSGIFPPFRGVVYNERLARPEDVAQLNRVLADLSGTNQWEFETQCFEMDRFIKKENR